jgi:hypothetical protein
MGWDLLLDKLEKNGSNAFDEITMTQLLDDSFSLGRAQKIDQLVFIRMLKYLVNETREMPFKAAFIGIDYIDLQLTNDFALSEAFEVYFMACVI